MRDKLKNFIKTIKLPFILDFIRWVGIDLYRKIKNHSKKRLWGLRIITGKTGSGKTTLACKIAADARAYYGDDIYIMTNFYFKDPMPENYIEMKHWKDMTLKYNKPLLCILDEANSLFSSKNFKNFPTELIHVITQNRKGGKEHGIFPKAIYAITQDYSALDISFRRYALEVISCRSILGRMFFASTFWREDYEMKYNMSNLDMASRVKPLKKDIFIASDDLREMYDSFRFVDTMLNTEYMDREELASLQVPDNKNFVNINNNISKDLKRYNKKKVYGA